MRNLLLRRLLIKTKASREPIPGNERMIEMNYGKEMFEEMIWDWKADNSPEMDELEIEEVEIDEDTKKWVAYATDEKMTYSLTDNGQGNIVINYIGTR